MGATAVRERGFQVDPPHTENLPSEGVAFTIAASRLEADAENATEGHSR